MRAFKYCACKKIKSVSKIQSNKFKKMSSAIDSCCLLVDVKFFQKKPRAIVHVKTSSGFATIWSKSNVVKKLFKMGSTSNGFKKNFVKRLIKNLRGEVKRLTDMTNKGKFSKLQNFTNFHIMISNDKAEKTRSIKIFGLMDKRTLIEKVLTKTGSKSQDCGLCNEKMSLKDVVLKCGHSFHTHVS